MSFQLVSYLKPTYQGISRAKLQQSWTVQHILRCVFPLLRLNPIFVSFQNLVVLQRTRVVEHPSHLTIKQGEEAFLRCAFSTDPDLLSSFEIHWLFGEERLEGQQDGEVRKHYGLTMFSGKRVKSGEGRPLLLLRSDQAGHCHQQSCMAQH